jgi:hypothetical protein
VAWWEGKMVQKNWLTTETLPLLLLGIDLSLGSYYYCNDLSLSFLFRFVPREASNLCEVRFGDVAVLNLFLVLHRKNS